PPLVPYTPLFRVWHFLEAVHIPASEYSLFRATYFFGQELPGLFFLILANFSRSLVFPLRLLKGTPKGEMSLKWRSSSRALDNCSMVPRSTVVAWGTNKKGVPQPTESKL